MYDTTGMICYTKETSFWKNLDIQREITDKKTGLNFNSGMLKNFRLYEFPEGIKLEGSLAKFHLGNNLEVLNRKTTSEAIENLSDCLGLRINDSKIYRIDFAQNFIMRDTVKKYLNCLDELRRFKKTTNEKSIYFHSDKIQLIIYDKLAEMSKKRQEIPEEFKQYKGRVLRYEMRYLRNLKKVFGKDVLLSDLAEENFYITLYKKWKEYYFSISKKNKLKFNDMVLKDVKTFQNQLMLIGLKALGFNEVLSMIELSKNNIHRMQLKRIKDKVKDLKQSKELTEINPLIEELNEKVKQSTLYYR